MTYDAAEVASLQKPDLSSNDEIQGSLHCGGKSASFGQDDVSFV
jgi:hypothetical protein